VTHTAYHLALYSVLEIVTINISDLSDLEHPQTPHSSFIGIQVSIDRME